jgi:hypothetical protein
MARLLFIQHITRIKADGAEETLEFEPGVNLLVGPTNSGKTVWLSMLDYLLGDRSGVEEAFGVEDVNGMLLTDSYVALRAVVRIGDEEFLLERHWKESGLKTKTIVDGAALGAEEFSHFMMEKLGIPLHRFVKGNPYADSKVVEISFRMMLRHMYLQERFWNDIAERQPPVEQHAVLAQMLSLTDAIFSPITEQIMERRKALLALQAEKKQFESVLDRIVRGFNHEGGSDIVYSNDITAQARIQELQVKNAALLKLRNDVISGGVSTVLQRTDIGNSVEVNLSQLKASLVADQERTAEDRERHTTRLQKFEGILANVDLELDRLNRLQTAGSVFADLKVTHCPACDQPVVDDESDPDNCFLCHRPLPIEEVSNRLDYELKQLGDERRELLEIIAKMTTELTAIRNTEARLVEQAAHVDRDLAPIREQVTALVDPRLSRIDAERGRIAEQIENYRRIARSLEVRNQLVRDIEVVTKQIQVLEKNEAQQDPVDFQQPADDLTAGMMHYINEIAKNKPDRWPLQGRIDLTINERGFNFNIGRTKWSSIGATLRAYFLLAYHYGLLRLSLNAQYKYPGFLVIDFPAALADGASLDEAENYLVQPFIDLCNGTEAELQVIIAGRSFENIQGATVYKFNKQR